LYTQDNRIDVKTYSPVIRKFMTDKDNQFTLKCDFTDRFTPRPKTPTTLPWVLPLLAPTKATTQTVLSH
jgi:hypothetical protein